MSYRGAVACLAVLAALFFPAPAGHAAGIAIGPYLMNATTRSVTVCWVSDDETVGTVRYAPTGLRPEPLILRPGAPASDWMSVSESTKSRYHRVKISGLRPYARYRYQVTCDGQTSEPATFRTAAPPHQPYRFVAYGDTRTQPDKHAAVIQRIIAFQPDFAIQTGDQVQDGTIEEQWAVFFATAQKMLKDTPYYPCLGNHERKGAPYFRYFDVPQDYSFDYGNAHFVALDSNRPEAEQAAQGEWLRSDLAAHQNATWRIVFFHHTPYTCVAMDARRTGSLKLRARLEPLFLAGKVQLVINGHDHTYQHHVGEGGIHYVVTGGGGAPLYDVRLDTPFTKAAKKAHHDCEITVSGSVLTLRAVEPDGTEIERFQLRAGGP